MRLIDPALFLLPVLGLYRCDRALKSPAEIRQQTLTIVAQSLELSAEQFDAQLKAKQTLPQIAQARGVPIETVNAAYVEAVKTIFASNIQSQSQLDQLVAQTKQDAASGNYMLLNENGPIQQTFPGP